MTPTSLIFKEQETLNTPHIDQVLSSYRERTVKSEDDSSPHVQARLLVLEQQLASLLKRSEEVYKICSVLIVCNDVRVNVEVNSSQEYCCTKVCYFVLSW